MAGIRARLRERFHESRADRFVALMRPSPGARVLDLGGGDGSLAERIAGRVRVDIAVADASADNRDAVLRRGFRHVLLEETGPLPFEPGEFDIVLCNSVIEHVTLPKAACSVRHRVPQNLWLRAARQAQRAFADQIRALAPSYFVQTPHRHFPVEQHVHLPFVQYLSHDNLCRVVSISDRWWIKSCHGTVDWELLTPGDVAELFPDARLTIERFGGLPKSILAWRRGPESHPTGRVFPEQLGGAPV